MAPRIYGIVSCIVIGASCGCESSAAELARARSGDGEAPSSPGNAGSGGAPAAAPATVTLRAAVQPIRRVEEARSNVFIPPYHECRDPLPGETGAGPNGQVCTQVAISGCTEPGKYFPDYASCEVVRTQRPFWPQPPAAESRPDDPRLNDPQFMGELGWATDQVKACGCVCCHDASANAGQAGQWDIRRGPIWLDTLSDAGLALFIGLADSSVLGAYPSRDNAGFDRTATGLPTTDTARMQAFLARELTRRGISREQAAAEPPFGGPIYENSVRKPGACKAEGHGIAADGRVIFRGAQARYVYVLSPGSKNPGVPPNLDLPEGTLWRLDVLASADPLQSGLVYGTTPPGSFQAYPEQAIAPELELGQTYQLTVLRDVGLPIANCLFTFGDEPDAPPPDRPASAKPSNSSEEPSPSGACSLPDADADGFGARCQSDTDCSCKASYCARMPGQAQGTCTLAGCKADPSVCPAGYSCLDLSIFGAELPAICTQA